MAAQVDPREPGPIVEIGPGTGPVTEALIARGVPQERLVLVEFNPDFIELLRKRFPLVIAPFNLLMHMSAYCSHNMRFVMQLTPG